MIRSFDSQVVKDVHNGVLLDSSLGLSESVCARMRRILDLLNIVKDVENIKIPGIDNCERYAGGMKSNWRVKVNEEWFLVFKYFDNDIYNLDLIRA